MASSNDNVSMALFCDFENVALGVRDANYEKFDIKPVLERLLLKGSIVVKKAYCDWDRYKGFKAPMHEGNFELIEIPHVRQSGKNSADIRMVVDALDLCYTKSHVNTFVIISGDSDFSPLVSKLRENNKKVIGVGVKQSTSDLLVANCDEFIFYDDLVREIRRAAAKRDTREGQPAVKRTPEEEKGRREEMDKRRREAVDMAVETFDALVSERGDSGKIWASVLKEAIKRRKPDFSESYYGFRTFGNLLEEAKARGLLEFGRDEKSGAYVYRSSGAGEQGSGEGSGNVSAPVQHEAAEGGRHEGRRGRGRGRNRGGERHASHEPVSEEVSAELQLAQDENAYAEAEAVHAADDSAYAQQAVADQPDAQQVQAHAQASPMLGSSEQDDLDEEERALDAAAAAIANSAGGNQRQLGRDGQPKRSAAKMPARQAKAQQKAAQSATAGDVWAKGKGRGKPVQGGNQRGKSGQPAPQAQASFAQAGAAQAGQAAGRSDVPAAVPVAQPAVQPADHAGVQPGDHAELPVVQPAVQPSARAGGRAAGRQQASRQPAAPQAAEAVLAPVADSAAAEADAMAKPAAKPRSRAAAKGRAKAGESRITEAAAEAATASAAPAAAEADQALETAADKPKSGRAAAARARAAKPVVASGDAEGGDQPARKPAARRPRKAE
ncbi:NYN domain-containing protein [Massilia sp. Root351]|jgi:uncharacterized LabA/DUF88 family protein|uniref:NYN domain-containing protein n=1 Tax=Massilia sp. Root351 TaxID=1736522 RepID=UPI0009E793AB|nr:NYN domain-containing protein [Massilia sp. Root351]